MCQLYKHVTKLKLQEGEPKGKSKRKLQIVKEGDNELLVAIPHSMGEERKISGKSILPGGDSRRHTSENFVVPLLPNFPWYHQEQKSDASLVCLRCEVDHLLR